jgi:hypothetical protein
MAKPNKTKKYQIVNVGDFNACICLSTHPNNFDRKNVFNNNNDDSKTNAKLKSIHCLLLSVILKRNKKTYVLLWFFWLFVRNLCRIKIKLTKINKFYQQLSASDTKIFYRLLD